MSTDKEPLPVPRSSNRSKQPRKRTHFVKLRVDAPVDMPGHRVRELVSKLIAAGQIDAEEADPENPDMWREQDVLDVAELRVTKARAI